MSPVTQATPADVTSWMQVLREGDHVMACTNGGGRWFDLISSIGWTDGTAAILLVPREDPHYPSKDPVNRLTRRNLPVSGVANCPFCGHDSPYMSVALRDGYDNFMDDPDAWCYAVVCRGCASEGPWAKSFTGASTRWNWRFGVQEEGP